MTFTDIAEIDDLLRSGKVDVQTLEMMWRQRQPVNDGKRTGKGNDEKQLPWLQESVGNAVRFAKCALDRKEYLLVCDVAREAIRYFTDDGSQRELVKIRMDYAAALTRLGCMTDARRVLKHCIESESKTRLGRGLKADLFLQLGNIVRDESRAKPTRASQLRHAEEALSYYRLALEQEPDRIDTMALTAAAMYVIGEPGSALRDEGAALAHRILQKAQEIERSLGLDFSSLQAQATAHAILGELDAAGTSYAQLKELPKVTTTQLGDARFYASILAEILGQPRDFFREKFGPLKLVVFAGHLPDRTGQPPRFPLDLMDKARQDIRADLEKFNPRVVVASAAAGADLLFIDEMLNRPQTEAIHIVLPWPEHEFYETSVRPYHEEDKSQNWEALFKRAMKGATTIRTVGQAYEPTDDVGWDYTMQVTAGVALDTARVSRMDIEPWVLWDTQPGRASGGTASFYHFWESDLKLKPHLITTLEHDKSGFCRINPGQSQRDASVGMKQAVKSMMFADIVGYSKLHERNIPSFVEHFMGRVSQIAGSTSHKPILIDTWGDCIYAVFDRTRDSGLFALELTQMIKDREAEWLANGLYYEDTFSKPGEVIKKPLNIRVGLHTGPVFIHTDPVVRRSGFTGAHVSRAARIEPIADPGDVFASEEFAAIAQLEDEFSRKDKANSKPEHVSFVSEYAGARRLAKDYPGLHRIYRVLPTHVFGVEEIAIEIHERYVSKALERGESPANNPSLKSWRELSDDLKAANIAQASDIPNKLRELGYELSPSYGLSPSEIKIIPAQVEMLAMMEHDRWMNERIKSGWTYAPVRDNAQKHHPLIVPWDDLSKVDKDKDREPVRNLPALIELAGFKVRKVY